MLRCTSQTPPDTKYSALKRVHSTRKIIFERRASGDGAIFMDDVCRRARPLDEVAHQQITDSLRVWIGLRMVLQEHFRIALKNANSFKALWAIAVGGMK